MVISSEFRMWQYRDNDHREDAPHFMNFYSRNSTKNCWNHTKPGKPLNERITRRRSVPTGAGHNGYGNGYNRPNWQNPSISRPQNLVGVRDFLSHKYLFYSSDNPNGWDYIVDDSLKFSFRFLWTLWTLFSIPSLNSVLVLYRFYIINHNKSSV